MSLHDLEFERNMIKPNNPFAVSQLSAYGFTSAGVTKPVRPETEGERSARERFGLHQYYKPEASIQGRVVTSTLGLGSLLKKLPDGTYEQIVSIEDIVEGFASIGGILLNHVTDGEETIGTIMVSGKFVAAAVKPVLPTGSYNNGNLIGV